MSFDLKKSLPKPGSRFVLPAIHGSADAYALAQAAIELKAQQRMLTVVVASPSDAQRLLLEIPWFGESRDHSPQESPQELQKKPQKNSSQELRCHLLPDWETLPYDAFSPPQDLVSERQIGRANV